jgi:hypothetical protein
MHEPAAAWRRKICQPCLHDEQDLPLGACTVTAGAGGRDLTAALGGEEETDLGRCDPDLVGGGGAVAEREDAGAHDAGERERAREWGSGKAREAGPGSRKTFPCARDRCFGEPRALAIVAERQNREIACAILHD